MKQLVQNQNKLLPIREYQIPTKTYLKANHDGRKLFYICPLCRKQWINKKQCSKHIVRCPKRTNIENHQPSSTFDYEKIPHSASLKIQTQQIQLKHEVYEHQEQDSKQHLLLQIQRLNSRIDELEGRKSIQEFTQIDYEIQAEQVAWRVWNSASFMISAIVMDKLKQTVIHRFKQHIDMRKNIEQLIKWVQMKVNDIDFEGRLQN